MSEPLALREFIRQEAIPQSTAYAWALQGWILTDASRRPATIPPAEIPIAALAARLHRRGVRGPALAFALAAVREIPPHERRRALTEAVLIKWPTGWAYHGSMKQIPCLRPGRSIVAIAVADLL